jgi:hypothetical protein
MTEPRYEIDGEGNLVEDPASKDEGDAAEASAREVTPEQARRFMRALYLSEVLGVVLLAGGAFVYPASQTLLLVFAAAYAIASIPATVYLRRDIYSRVRRGSPG